MRLSRSRLSFLVVLAVIVSSPTDSDPAGKRRGWAFFNSLSWAGAQFSRRALCRRNHERGLTPLWKDGQPRN